MNSDEDKGFTTIRRELQLVVHMFSFEIILMLK
jgi:hypothetical protein